MAIAVPQSYSSSVQATQPLDELPAAPSVLIEQLEGLQAAQ